MKTGKASPHNAKLLPLVEALKVKPGTFFSKEEHQMNKPTVKVMRPSEVPSEAYPWGNIQWLVSKQANGAGALTLGHTVVEPGGRNPLHRHPNCEEVLYVVSGEIEHIVEGWPTVRMKAGEAIWIPRNVLHRAINVGAIDAELLVAFSSAERETVIAEE